jgi:multicomponent Na+:H+ antiporter subunit G
MTRDERKADELSAGHLHDCCGLRRSLLFLAGTIGLLRFPDALTRVHALTKADNLGLGLVVLGLLPRAQGPLEALKLVTVWLLVLLASGRVSQLIGRAARRGSLPE